MKTNPITMIIIIIPSWSYYYYYYYYRYTSKDNTTVYAFVLDINKSKILQLGALNSKLLGNHSTMVQLGEEKPLKFTSNSDGVTIYVSLLINIAYLSLNNHQVHSYSLLYSIIKISINKLIFLYFIFLSRFILHLILRIFQQRPSLFELPLIILKHWYLFFFLFHTKIYIYIQFDWTLSWRFFCKVLKISTKLGKQILRELLKKLSYIPRLNIEIVDDCTM